MSLPNWTVRVASNGELEACLAIRREVFVVGQNVPEELEVDGLDPEAVHFIALHGERAAATARMRLTSNRVAKAERVAVRAPFRGRGLGARIMDVLEAEAGRRGRSEVVLWAQVQVMGFYANRGYRAFGPHFMDAGIPHREMRLTLPGR